MHLDPSLIVERQFVLERVHRLFWAIDARHWDMAAALCASGVDWAGLEQGQFPASLQKRLGGVVTHHQCTNPLIKLDDDRAEVSLLVVARHRRATLRGADTFVRMSTDRLTLQRRAEEWLVTALSRTVQMAEGNPGVLSAPGNPEPPASTAPLPPEPPARSDVERLARMADRQAIHDLMMRFGRGLDGKDWELYRSCFAGEVVVDFAHTTGLARRRVPADGFVAFARMRQRGHAAFHQYSNFQASVNGDRARCILYLAARHRAPDAGGDPLNVFIGWYDNEFVRTADGWRISALRHPLQWVEGNSAIKDAPDPEAEAIGRQLFEPAETA